MPWPRVAAYTLALALAFLGYLDRPHGVYWAQRDPAPGRLGYDSELVLNRLHEAAAGRAGPLDPLVTYTPERGRQWYASQLGLQGIALGAIQRAAGVAPESLTSTISVVLVALGAFLFALIYAPAARWVSPTAASIAVGLTACVPIIPPFAASVYWCLPLMLGPFLAAWLLYPSAIQSRRRFALWFGATALAVALKCLCGYEYLTTVAAAPAAALAFHAARLQIGWKTWAKHTSVAALAGVLGFAVALGLHLGQLRALFGPEGVEKLRERAAHRLGEGSGAGETRFPFFAPEVPGLPPERAFQARCLLNYFYQSAAGSLTLGVVTLLALVTIIVALVARRRLSSTRQIAGATLVGFGASVSWQLIAVNHMCVHAHLNGILFAVAFLPLAFLLFGSLLPGKPGDERLRVFADRAGVALFCLWLTIAQLAQHGRRDAWTRAEAAAVDRVRNLLASGAPLPGGLSVQCDAAPLRDFPPHPLFGPMRDAGVLPSARGDAAPCRVATGWVFDPADATGRYPVVLLIVDANGVRVAPAGRFTRPDLERAAGRSLPTAGYEVTLPPAGARLFAVGGPGGGRVAEIDWLHAPR